MHFSPLDNKEYFQLEFRYSSVKVIVKELCYNLVYTQFLVIIKLIFFLLLLLFLVQTVCLNSGILFSRFNLASKGFPQNGKNFLRRLLFKLIIKNSKREVILLRKICINQIDSQFTKMKSF